MAVVINALRIKPVPNVAGPNGETVLAELVPTKVLLDRKPDTKRIGDYLLLDHHQYEGSIFDPTCWDGVYDCNLDIHDPGCSGTSA